MKMQNERLKLGVGEVLRKHRKTQRLTQADLAHESGLTPNEVHRLESKSANFDRWLQRFWTACSAMGQDPVEVLRETRVAGEAGDAGGG